MSALALGIPDERIVLKRDPSPVTIAPSTQPLPLPPELADRVVLLYSGNFGVAHDHETLIAGYRLHHREGSGRVGLWLNATGRKADLVETLLRSEGLPVHRSAPLPLDELARLLVTPNAHLITLRDEFVGYALPSKVHGCIASGRDVLYVGPEQSDVHLLCTQGLEQCAYLHVATGEARRFANALETIADRAVTGPMSKGSNIENPRRTTPTAAHVGSATS